MPGPEKVVAEWVQKAESDLKNAVQVIKLGAECPADTVCFHAQQCVEKYLKALLVSLDIDFPKTHDIDDIVSLVPPSHRIDVTDQERQRLTRYATVTRYPGDYPAISLTEARKAVAIARRVRRDVRRQLPRQALRKKAI